MVSLNTIKNWFKTGLKPTQEQFWDTWDSFWHKNENIPVDKIDGIDNLLNQKANDIEYAYASQLAQETSAVIDRHIHPIEPRMVRITLTHRFN